MKFVSHLDRTERFVRQVGRASVAAVAKDLKRSMRRRVPVDEGETRREIVARMLSDRYAQVGTTTEQGRIVEHVAPPRERKWVEPAVESTSKRAQEIAASAAREKAAELVARQVTGR